MTEAEGRAKLQKRAIERRRQLGMRIGRQPRQRSSGDDAQGDEVLRAAADRLGSELERLRSEREEHTRRAAELTKEISRVSLAVNAMRGLLGLDDVASDMILRVVDVLHANDGRAMKAKEIADALEVPQRSIVSVLTSYRDVHVRRVPDGYLPVERPKQDPVTRIP